MSRETEKLEFKVTLTNDVYKEVVAFANTEGGTLIIGVNDAGEVTPLPDTQSDYLRLTNGIRDKIVPDVTMFTKPTLANNQTIHIEVEEGTYKPYYLKEKGLKPSGVYVRQGISSTPASTDAIRRMIKDADGDVYEELCSRNQELTFNRCEMMFKKDEVKFSESKFSILGILTPIGQLYTNLGLLLSDQNPHTIKVAVFDNEANTIFKDRKEFGGSIFKQLDEVLGYLDLNNNIRSVITGLERKDFFDYPKQAIREAVLNAAIHRDYSFSGSIIININRHAIEIVSIGGLLPGINPDDVVNGVSQLRNKKLADIFFRLNIIEAYGTGIKRIFSLYKECPVKPKINIATNSFKMTLPNMNDNKVSNANTVFAEATANSNMGRPSKQEQTILDYLETYGEMTDEQVQELLTVKKTRSFVILKKMSDFGLIKITGRGVNRKITLS